jgi:hypothetical protein
VNIIDPERVSEALWQTIAGVNDLGLEAHEAWLALPEGEKQFWREHAKVAIADWQKHMGQTPPSGSRSLADEKLAKLDAQLQDRKRQLPPKM